LPEYKNLPDMNGWASLRALVEKGGVLEAARTLNVGQPAVTKRLRTLEKCYGIPLLERISGRLRLTDIGEKVYLLAVQTLDRQMSLREEITNLSQGKSSLRLEVTFGIGEHYKIETRLAYSRQIQTDLATRRADMALVESAPDHPDILVQKWLEDELWMLCGPEHPLAGTDMLPVEDLADQLYVLRESRSSIRESLDEALSRIKLEPLNIAFEVGSSEAIIDILERNQHVSFLPRFAVYERVSAGELFHIKITGFRILRTLWIARNRAALDHPVAETFIDMIRKLNQS